MADTQQTAVPAAGPGLGVTLNEDAVERLTVEKR